MQEHILRHRVRGYREGDLLRLLHGDGAPLPAAQRTAFEHHLADSHNLAALPLDAWPHLLAAMQRRTRTTGAWSGKLTARERELAPHLLAEIAARGPLGSEDFADDRRAHRQVWGQSSLVKSTLQKLFFHGRLLIAQRLKNRRRYDLPERVLPARVRRLREPDREDTARWLAHLKLRQRRLVTLKRDELPRVEDLVQPIAVPDCPPLFCLREDVSIFERLASSASEPEREARAPLLLAPLDPLFYDRRVTQRLWAFDYTWEVYTPPAKRKRGYYALPVLAGLEIVGHIDPKADRARGKLLVAAHRLRPGYRAAPAVEQLAAFLDLRR